MTQVTERVVTERTADEVAVCDAAPDAIEATVNYILDTGETPYTYSGGPGSTFVESHGMSDPRRVVMHDGRPEAGRFALDRDGFRFIRHDTRVISFFDKDEVRSVYYAEMEA